METDNDKIRQLHLNMRMIEAVKLSDFEKVKKLVEEGAEIQFDNNEALRTATASNDSKTVKYLLSKGADMLDAPTSNSFKYLNALQWAKREPIESVFLNHIRKEKLKKLSHSLDNS
jgi:hypothetical protein